MDAWWWVWAILLLVCGLALAVLEIFIPSGGVLGFLAICAIIASVVLAFAEGQMLGGVAFLTLAIFGLPAVIVLALKYWPRTAMGRKVLLAVPDSDDVLPDGGARLRDLIGQTGRAKSAMLPGGAIVIDGRTLDAVSDGVPIEAGQAIRVVDVKATTLIVRPAEPKGPEPSDAAADPLSRPIDAVGPDPFEEPGA